MSFSIADNTMQHSPPSIFRKRLRRLFRSNYPRRECSCGFSPFRSLAPQLSLCISSSAAAAVVFPRPPLRLRSISFSLSSSPLLLPLSVSEIYAPFSVRPISPALRRYRNRDASVGITASKKKSNICISRICKENELRPEKIRISKLLYFEVCFNCENSCCPSNIFLTISS